MGRLSFDFLPDLSGSLGQVGKHVHQAGEAVLVTAKVLVHNTRLSST